MLSGETMLSMQQEEPRLTGIPHGCTPPTSQSCYITPSPSASALLRPPLPSLLSSLASRRLSVESAECRIIRGLQQRSVLFRSQIVISSSLVVKAPQGSLASRLGSAQCCRCRPTDLDRNWPKALNPRNVGTMQQALQSGLSLEEMAVELLQVDCPDKNLPGRELELLLGDQILFCVGLGSS
ncbi:hypothetical protein RRG08_066999 [Elysia crispata]|uniref:Uncharacterized protein n=1 Tax=Elysia crispata TaxID=231223 RepID=A0AAE0Z9Y0_9GAST|nr:hypothetical protein RRG08_066999 [Elysia crispata]